MICEQGVIPKGVPPEERSYGRTLAEDLQWVCGALARL